jgi:hypothetical protein
MRIQLPLAALIVGLTALTARAGDPPCSAADHTHEQAGCPLNVACYAIPGRTAKDGLGYIGGGCVGLKGEPRCPNEGIFGMDYVGCGWYPGRVFLSWCHCNKQPPAGPYKTDGPHVPDAIAILSAHR